MVDYIALIDKYYASNPDLWHVLVIHSIQVRDRALRIVDAHPEWVEQGLVDRRFVEEASMLHDIGIIFCNAHRIFCTGSHQYVEHGYLGAELLRREGLPRHADVAERHTGSGITIDQIIREDLPLPVKDYCPRTLEEKIICYSDRFYSKTHLGKELTVSKIRKSLWKYGHDAIMRWEAMVALMGEDLSATPVAEQVE